MRRLLLLLTLLVTVNLGAQEKEIQSALKDLSKAKEKLENPKRAEEPKYWLRLVDAYISVYDAPVQSLWIGASQVEVKLLAKDQKILSSEVKKVNGVDYTVDTYDNKELYYDGAGKLVAWKVTKKYIDVDPLKEALTALDKAATLGAKEKDLLEKYNALKSRFTGEAMNEHALGDFGKASASFEVSAQISQNKVVNQVDTLLLYYTGLTASMNKDNDRAIKFYEMALESGYDASGDLYGNLGEAYKAKNDIAKTKEILSKGFQKYPTNQSILVTLINTYMDTNDDPNKVLELIRQAQSNEPKNPSLYYAEGNVWVKLKNLEKAMECYKKALEADPTYVFAEFAMGQAYYDTALELQGKASEEQDMTKYEDLVKQQDEYLELSIAPFEKAFEMTEDKDVKSVVAEYLKNIYFRFRDKGDKYSAGYDKYNTLYKQFSGQE